MGGFSRRGLSSWAMHDRLQSIRRKILGELQTKNGAVISQGGAEFDGQGHGFFVPAVGSKLAAIPPEQSGVIAIADGQRIAVRDLGTAPSTSSLPQRYTFTYRGRLGSRRV
jgi:hypothetical protein